MNIKHSITFVVALMTAAPGLGQGTSTRPLGPGLVGGPIGPGPIGPGPIGPGPIGAGPMGLGPIGLGVAEMGLIGEGPLGLMPEDLALDAGHMDAFSDPQDRDREREQREREAEQREKERENRIYEQAQEAMDQNRYDRAIERFSDVISMKGARVDAALYWKAFSQNRQGQREEALTTIAELSKNYPKSRYLTQAKALEVEVRGAVGQPVRPQDQADEELKLMALQALQNSDPEQAIPMLQKLLDGTASPRLKQRALFVLAQSNSQRARDALKAFAKGSSTPELQSKAIQYLGVHGGSESRAALGEIYAATNDVDVKRRILRAFMVAGEKSRLLTAANSEQNADLRAEAVRQLGVMGAHDELWQLYQKETSVDVRKQVIHAMFVGGNVSRMIDLAKTEPNVDLRRAAVRNLGLMGSKRTGDALVEIYAVEKDASIRKSVINALFLQENATALVALARKEPDLTLKKEMVQKLSHMRSKVATDYMLELLK